MVHITPDPTNPDRLVLTATVSLYIDRLVTNVLSEEIAAQVKEQATKSLRNTRVKKVIAEAAVKQLLNLLSNTGENNNEKG